jgi:hypothetical protein
MRRHFDYNSGIRGPCVCAFGRPADACKRVFRASAGHVDRGVETRSTMFLALPYGLLEKPGRWKAMIEAPARAVSGGLVGGEENAGRP